MTGSDVSEIQIPKAYTDAINTPEGVLWKEAMDYELTKLEEMDTWSKINEANVPSSAQVLLGIGFTS